MQNRNIYPYLVKAKASKKTGEVPIYISIDIDNKQVAARSTGRKVLPTDWDADLKCVKASVANAALINAAITKKINDYDAEFLRKDLLGAPVTKSAVRLHIKGKSNLDYGSFVKEQVPIHYSNDDTKAQHLSEISKLEKYRKGLTFADINFEFLSAYRAYMRDKLKNEPNTIWKTFKAMHRMCELAIELGVLQSHPMDGFDSASYESTIPDYLEWDEVQRVKAVLLTDQSITPAVRKAGWHFILQCCSGLRFGDVSKFKYSDFVRTDSTGNRLILETKKTGEIVSIAFTSMIQEAVDNVMADPYMQPITNQYYNRDLKIVGGIAKLNVSLASHMGRHTFGMRCAELGMREEDVMKLMGHKNIKHTRIYFRIKNKRLDEAMGTWEAAEMLTEPPKTTRIISFSPATFVTNKNV